MTPKEKAQELYVKFRNELDFALDFDICRTYSRRIAILAVDEILEALGYKSLSDSPYTTLEARQYYVQVKQEIENL